MNKITLKRIAGISTLSLAFVISGCSSSSGGDKENTSGDLSLMVSSAADQSALADVLVFIFDNNNAFVESAKTDANGLLELTLEQGTYTARIQAQGYEMSPPRGVAAVPFEVVANEDLDSTIELSVNEDAALENAWVNGNLGDNSGVLVVASAGEIAVSALTDDKGNYTLFNVAAGEYTLTSYHAGMMATPVMQAIAEGENTVNISVEMNDSLPSLTGNLSFIAGGTKKSTDVSLLHPVTLDVIPGLTISTDNTYTLKGIPSGSYIAWASFANDLNVMDPDWIFKNGPTADEALSVTVTMDSVLTADDSSTLNFSLTGAVQQASPTNAVDGLAIPAEVDTLTPTFTWKDGVSSYSSADQFVLEVFDLQGNSVWGGPTETTILGEAAAAGSAAGTHTHIPGDVYSKEFNFDDAGAMLEDGKTYIWRVTAYQNKMDSDISAKRNIAQSTSEDQMGLFKVVLQAQTL
ncbi:MAG: carboxypeptidase regulatory-like domain-containing protein [Pseudomonadales bacterium]|nr:carboxypeptidase regulatory-like domain-containing protein [Pseudomonadales bacterium]